MKSSNDFEPIYLQDAKRHIEWLYNKIKNSQKNTTQTKSQEISLLAKVINFLKRVF